MTVAMMSSSLVLVVVLVTATLTAEARSSSDLTCYSDCRDSSSSSKSNHHSKCSPASATVGFAILAIQNVRAFCVDEQKSCTHKETKDNWSLHGLWPSKNYQSNSSYVLSKNVDAPVYCDLHSSFDMDAVEDLRTNMEQNWPSLGNKEENKFWTHEWCKHGTCAVASQELPGITDQHSYFQKALELYEQAAVTDNLKRAGIDPSDDKTTVETIMLAFKNKPKLDCKLVHSNDGTRRTQVLNAIKFCYSTATGLEPVSCNLEWFPSQDTQHVCQNGPVLLNTTN